VYILDTNSLSEVFRYGLTTLLGSRIALVPNPKINLRVTVITYEEMLAGRIIQLTKDPKKNPRLEPLYNRYSLLEQTYIELRRYYPPLPFDVNAQAVFNAIPKKVRDQAKVLDCRIAAIAVAHDHTVITANQKDFIKIEKEIGVKWVDWTIAPLDS